MGSLDTVPEEEITNPKKGTSLKNEFLMTPRVQGVRIRWARILVVAKFTVCVAGVAERTTTKKKEADTNSGTDVMKSTQ